PPRAPPSALAAGAEAEAAPEVAAPAAPDVSGDGKSFVSPVVARIASEHDVDVAQVPGTGRGGRVTKKDILSFIESGAQAAAPAAPAEGAAAPAAPEAPAAPPAPPHPAAAPP